MHRIWRTLGLSDHLYYMFTAGGGAGIVHSYFSPYGNPFDAAITYLSVLSDLHFRLKNMLSIADEPFIFTSSEKTPREMVWSLEALYGVLAKIEIEALEQHVKRGDLAQWARFSLGDDSLARKIEDIEDLEGDELRHEIMKIIESRRKRRL
jgi:alpha-amylase